MAVQLLFLWGVASWICIITVKLLLNTLSQHPCDASIRTIWKRRLLEKKCVLFYRIDQTSIRQITYRLLFLPSLAVYLCDFP